MSIQLARARYVENAVNTISPRRLVIMLYDALVSDLVLAQDALERKDLETVNKRLVRAQDIVLELHSGLDVHAWEGAPALKQIYVFLYDRLVAANVRKDTTLIAECRRIVEPIRDAWAAVIDPSTSRS
jgi:flagellar protein FliS